MIQLSSQNHKVASSHQPQTLPLYDALHLQQKSVASLKSAFVHWIRSLLMEERFLALKIYSGPIPQIIRNILPRLEISQGERCSEILSKNNELLPRGESCGDQKKMLRKLEKAFYDSLVFVSDGQDFIDHICFEFGLLQCPDKLFDLLTATVDNPSTKLFAEVLSNREPIQLVGEKILASSTLEQVAIVTLRFLRQEILLRFRQSMLNSQFLSKSLEEEKRRKKEFSTHLKYLPEDLKRRMVFLGFKDIEELKQWFFSNEIKIDFLQLQKEAQELLKLQKNQFSNRIFKCKLKKSQSEIIAYHEQIYIYWKNDLARHKKRKFSKKFSSEKIEKETMQQAKCQQNDSKQQHYPKRKKNRRKKSVSVESNETNVTWQEKKIQKRKIFTQIETSYEVIPPKIEEKPISQHKQIDKVKEKVENLAYEPNDKKRNKKRKGKEDKFDQKCERSIITKQKVDREISSANSQPMVHYTQEEPLPKKKMSLSHQHLRQLALSSIAQELQEFADKISEEANQYHDRRIIAFERIQFLLSYYYVNIQLFGSCASGIAIQNSDIDIAVKNQILGYFDYVPDHLRLIGALQNLQQIFASQDYIFDINLISTAAIPIIKLKIDTSKTCLNPQYGEIFQRLNRPHNSGIIEADITIETLNHQSQCNHLGIISTQTINQWLSEIPSLHYIVITLKFLLQNRGLHKTYEGGLNTFTMIVLVVSFIYHAKFEKETNSALVLEQLLKFYAYQFDEKQTGIDLMNYGTSSIFYSKLQKAKEAQHQDTREKADLEIIDPKCRTKNITRKCYLFPQIKDFFKQIYQQCFEAKFKSLEELIKMEEKHSCNLSYIEQGKLIDSKANSFEQLIQTQ